MKSVPDPLAEDWIHGVQIAPYLVPLCGINQLKSIARLAASLAWMTDLHIL